MYQKQIVAQLLTPSRLKCQIKPCSHPHITFCHPNTLLLKTIGETNEIFCLPSVLVELGVACFPFLPAFPLLLLVPQDIVVSIYLKLFNKLLKVIINYLFIIKDAEENDIQYKLITPQMFKII